MTLRAAMRGLRVMFWGLTFTSLLVAGACGKKSAPVTPPDRPTQPSQEKERQTLPPQ